MRSVVSLRGEQPNVAKSGASSRGGPRCPTGAREGSSLWPVPGSDPPDLDMLPRAAQVASRGHRRLDRVLQPSVPDADPGQQLALERTVDVGSHDEALALGVRSPEGLETG